MLGMVVHCVHMSSCIRMICVLQQTLMDWFVLDAAADVSTWCGAAGCHLPFPSPPFPSHHPSREAVPLLPFFFTTSSWLPSAGCSARVLSCTIYWWRSLEPMTGSGSTSTLLWDGVSLAFAPLNLQYLCGFRFSVKVLPWDAVQYHAICQEYMCTYIGYCTNVKCLYVGGHVESMAVMGHAHCVSCTISLQLYIQGVCCCVFSVLISISDVECSLL